MSAEFVPLLQTLRPAASAQQPAAGEPAFSPLAPPPQPGAPPPCQGEAKIECQKENGRIQQIRVHCKCGEVIEIHCDY